MAVINYEFPEVSPETSTYDANWLMLSVHLETGAGHFQTGDACLLTWELQNLAEQLEMLSTPQQHRHWQVELQPLEPYVKLRFLEDDMGIFFMAELTLHGTGTLESHKVQWQIERHELEAFRIQLNGILSLFPVKEKL